MPADPLRVRFALSDLGLLQFNLGIDCKPVQSTNGAACFDLFAAEGAILTQFRPQLISCGIHIEIPAGYEGIIRGRSGMAKKGIILAWGTVDADFRGEVKANLINLNHDEVGGGSIKVGDRIAQLAIRPIPNLTFERVSITDLTSTERGSKGWGSTGR